MKKKTLSRISTWRVEETLVNSDQNQMGEQSLDSRTPEDTAVQEAEEAKSQKELESIDRSDRC